MSIKGKIKTLFSDKEKTEALFPRTKVSAVSDDNGVGLNVLLEQTVPMTRGGTGAENGAEGLANMFAAGSTVLSPYQYGTELPTNAAVGQVYFEEATGTIADIGQDVAKALRAVNLLDNSDFRNPINQRGFSGIGTGAYGLDRWVMANADWSNNTLTMRRNMSLSDSNGWIIQRLETVLSNRLNGKTVTGAVKCDGVWYAGSGTFSNNETVHFVYTDAIQIFIQKADCVEFVVLTTDEGTTHTIEQVALYEGEYTVETLPPYIPKGYGAELMECRRYYCKMAGRFVPLVNNDAGHLGAYAYRLLVDFPVVMRAVPSVTLGAPAASIYNKPAVIAEQHSVLLYHNNSSAGAWVQTSSIEASADL